MNPSSAGRPRLDGRVIRAAGAIALLGLLRERGIDGGALVEAVGLPPHALGHPDDMIPLTALGRLLVRGGEAAGIDDIGLAVGSRMTFDALGFVGYMLANAETVGAGLGALARYMHVNNNAAVPFLHREDGLAVFGYEPFSPAYPGSDQIMFGSIAIVTNSMRTLCGPAFRLRGVEFSYGAHGGARSFQRFFGCPLSFNATRNAVLFDAAWLDWPIAQADPTLRSLIERQLRARKPPGEPPTPADAIRRVMRTMLLAGSASEEDVARAFAMSRRTLARRLRDAGSSYQREIDLARSETARLLLESSAATIADIAARLGYAGTASFTRAFTRWEGMSPGRWRRDAKRL